MILCIDYGRRAELKRATSKVASEPDLPFLCSGSSYPQVSNSSVRTSPSFSSSPPPSSSSSSSSPSSSSWKLSSPFTWKYQR